MTERRFQTVSGSELAKHLGVLAGSAAAIDVNSAGTLGNLQSGALTFLSAPTEARIAALAGRDDIIVLVPEGHAPFPFPAIVVPNPRLALAQLLGAFFKPNKPHEISEQAIIDPTAKIGKNVNIGHFSIIGSGVEIGDNTFIGNNVEIYDNVSIGSHCHVKSQAVIGQDGFGFEKDGDENYQRLPHIGGAILSDWVELGSHSTIAAGTIEPTRIGAFTKIDDHTHVGHNCQIGENNIICGGAIISGSIRTESHVWFGPNSCMMQGLHFETDCTIGVGAVMYVNGKQGTSYGVRPALPSPKKQTST